MHITTEQLLTMTPAQFRSFKRALNTVTRIGIPYDVALDHMLTYFVERHSMLRDSRANDARIRRENLPTLTAYTR